MSVNEKMTAIADALRSYTGETDKLGLDAMAEGVNDAYNVGVYDAGYANGYENGCASGHTQGVQAEYDRFWDSFQTSGNRRNYPSGFAGSCWKNDTYNPKYEIIVTSLATNMFYANTMITSTKVPITIDSTVVSTGVFAGCTRLQEIPSIKVTEKVSAFTSWFADCDALRTINFTDDSVIAKSINFQWCPLTAESAWNIVSHLAYLDDPFSQTITFSDEVWDALEAYTAEHKLHGWTNVQDMVAFERGWNIA